MPDKLLRDCALPVSRRYALAFRVRDHPHHYSQYVGTTALLRLAYGGHARRQAATLPRPGGPARERRDVRPRVVPALPRRATATAGPLSLASSAHQGRF